MALMFFLKEFVEPFNDLICSESPMYSCKFTIQLSDPTELTKHGIVYGLLLLSMAVPHPVRHRHNPQVTKSFLQWDKWKRRSMRKKRVWLFFGSCNYSFVSVSKIIIYSLFFRQSYMDVFV